MPQSHLPNDPLAAHEVLMQRAEQLQERRSQERRNPLPEQAVVELCFVRRRAMQCIKAEVIDLSASGMRLAAFADQQIEAGDRCEISVHSNHNIAGCWATVRWVKPHPLIQVFGVQFDAPVAV